MRHRVCLSVLVASLWAGAAPAQQAGPLRPAPLQSAAVVIDVERLFLETEVGRRIVETLDRAAADLAAENREIEQALIEEEKVLTEQRAEMAPEDFRTAADAFDEKVTRIRSEQDRKSRLIANRREEQQRAFLDAALPVLGGLLADYGAYIILDRRQVFLSDDRVDVTEEAILRLDAALASATEPAPETANDTSETPTEAE